MTDNPFKKATKENARLRMAITGPSGSGKTYTALTLATAIGKTAVLDTERGSAKKYADLFDFDVLEIETFSPALYIQAIKRAVEFGYEVIVLDSLSHAWVGIGGVLNIVENEKKKVTNQFMAWAKGTDEQNNLIDAILSSDIHVIGTMRSKTEYVIGDDKKPVKVGMAPIQRDGFEYEFDIIGAMDMENDMVIEKTRCPALTGKVIKKPNGELSQTLRAWLSDGTAAESSTPTGQEPDEKRTVPAPDVPVQPLQASSASDNGKDAVADIINANEGDLTQSEISELDAHFGPRHSDKSLVHDMQTDEEFKKANAWTHGEGSEDRMDAVVKNCVTVWRNNEKRNIGYIRAYNRIAKLIGSSTRPNNKIEYQDMMRQDCGMSGADIVKQAVFYVPSDADKLAEAI